VNIKRIWLIIPALLMPYVVLTALAVIMFSADNEFCGFIMDEVLGGNALWIVPILLMYSFVAMILSALCLIMGIKGNWEALPVAKMTMIIKLIQIPAYVVIFLLSAIFIMMIFTIGFAIAFAFFDFLTLLMSGMLGILSVVQAIRNGKVSFKESWWVILLQFIYCADVVATVIFYVKLKKVNAKEPETVQKVTNAEMIDWIPNC